MRDRYEEQDPDTEPHLSEKSNSDPDPHYSEKMDPDKH